MALIEKNISNHPTLDYERIVVVAGGKINDDAKVYSMYCRVKHLSDGIEVLPVRNVTLEISNSYKDNVLDENGNIISNTEWEPEYELLGHTQQPEGWNPEVDGEFVPQPVYGEEVINLEDQVLRKPAYDYFKEENFLNYNRQINEFEDRGAFDVY